MRLFSSSALDVEDVIVTAGVVFTLFSPLLYPTFLIFNPDAFMSLTKIYFLMAPLCSCLSNRKPEVII